MTTSSSSKTIAIALTSLFALSTLAACTPSKTAVEPKQPAVAKDVKKPTDDKKAGDKKMDEKKADEKKADEKQADVKKPEPKK